ncbi:unnamed protein product [Brassica oleracea]
MPSIQTPPARILQLEMENFKSYKGHQLVGPFKDFTAIIGPNGAGKSNLMDAISFVLGVRTGQLRGSQLKDLIYAFDDREKEQRGRRAFVRLVYLLDDGVELRFTCAITSAGGSEYRIDNRVVNWDEYNGKLRSLGILVKARNFLVFQLAPATVSTEPEVFPLLPCSRLIFALLFSGSLWSICKSLCYCQGFNPSSIAVDGDGSGFLWSDGETHSGAVEMGVGF